MKRAAVISTLLFTASLFFSNAVAQETLSMRVGNFFPNYFQDKNGNWKGIDVDLGVALIKAAGYEPEIVNLPWNRALFEARKGKIDILVNTNLTAERSEYMHWIGPERYTSLSLVVHKDNLSLPITKLDDFITACKKHQMRFGYQQNVKYSPEFQQRIKADDEFKSCFEPIAVANLNARKTIFGRILGYFDEPLDIKSEIKRSPDYQLAVHNFTLIREPVFFGVSKEAVSAETLIKLYEAYEKLATSGKLEEIRKKWEE